MTPYQYVNNNPINMIDPTGMYGERWEGGGYGDKKGDSWASRAWGEVKSWFGRGSDYQRISQNNAKGKSTIEFGELEFNGNIDDDISLSTIQCHHTLTVSNGEKIDLTGNFGGLYINGIGGYNMGGNNIEGDHTTINYDDITLFGAGGAHVKGVLKAIQYLSSSFSAYSSLNASDKENINKYTEDLKKDSVYSVRGTIPGYGIRQQETSTNVDAQKLKKEFESKGVKHITIKGKQKKE